MPRNQPRRYQPRHNSNCRAWEQCQSVPADQFEIQKEEVKNMEMSQIAACTMSACAYNKENHCHTLGITVGPHAECNTFSHASKKGGSKEANGGVGACIAADCKFNDQLECKAPNINVTTHNAHPDCKTFQPRK